MWQFISRYMQRYSESVFLSDRDGAEYGYSDILSYAEYHGKKLRETIPAGCKCAVVCRSEFHTAISILAAWYAELIPIPVSLHYGDRLCHAILELTAPDVVITDEGCEEKFSPEISVYRIEKSCFSGVRKRYIPDTFLRDAALIMCTSGTTGTPKGAVITKCGLISNALAIDRYFPLSPADTVLMARPLYHCAVLTGEFLIALLNGASIIFGNSGYSPQGIIEICSKYPVTVLCGTPSLFRHIALLSELGKNRINLRIIALSGECLPSSSAKIIRNAFPQADIYHVYGLTEASPRVSYLPSEQFDRCPESVGVPLHGTEIKIVNADGTERKSFEHGLILVKSPSVMKGYYRNKALTDSVIQNGWLRTGDIGYKDDEGKLYIMSRADDLIIKGGMNIYPREIENQVLALEQFDECVVYGFLNGEFQAIGIDIVLNPAYRELTKKEIKKILASVLPPYQVPIKIEITASLQKTASGKIVRNRSGE